MSVRSVPTTPPYYLVEDFLRDPHQAMCRTLREYGDIVQWRGIDDMYLVNHPDLVRPVLTQDYRHFSKDTPQTRMLSQVAGKGLLTNDGPDWVRQRRLIQPVFGHRELVRFDDLINALTASVMDEWDRRDSTEVVWIDREMGDLAFSIVGQTLFRHDVEEHSEEMEQLREALNLPVSGSEPQVGGGKVSAGSYREFRDAVDGLSRLAYTLIGGRKEKTNGTDSLLDRLAAARDEESGEGMDDRQMRDEVVTLLFAGHDTSAMALTWTLYLLATHPEIAERLCEHLETTLHGAPAGSGDLARLPYLKQVVQEALRIYPPIWAYSRRAEHETEVGEFVLPAKALVVICTYALHRHPEFWPDPERFDPDRFHPDRKWEFFSYLPFAAGPRTCVGASKAMIEIQLVLAQIVPRFRMQVVPDHPIETEGKVTLGPRHGIPVTLTRR